MPTWKLISSGYRLLSSREALFGPSEGLFCWKCHEGSPESEVGGDAPDNINPYREGETVPQGAIRYRKPDW
jgi:hypothetical protein